MFDARLEINIYRLLRGLGKTPGPWIGAPIKLAEQSPALEYKEVESVLGPQVVAGFERCTFPSGANFLSVREGRFEERDCDGIVLAEAPFEYVLPQDLSVNTAVALPVVRTGEGTFAGIELRDLPASQTFAGNSTIATTPAWRVSTSINYRSELHPLIIERMNSDFGVRVSRLWELGGSYFPTPGITPETVYPFVAEVEASDVLGSRLHFVNVSQLVNKLDLVQDAHLLIAICRFAHAVGLAS
jgi:hypothetical protein